MSGIELEFKCIWLSCMQTSDFYCICHCLWYLPQELLFLFLGHVCELLSVFLILYYVLYYLLKHSLPELASRLSAHIVTLAGKVALEQLDGLYHSAIRFSTNAPYRTHHCTLYSSVNCLSLYTGRKTHWLMLIYKTI